jgi:hypothetical protein
MRKTLYWTIATAAVVATVFAVAAVAATASTSGAHFMSASGSVNGAGALVVSWDEAGLGNEDINYTLTANASATYACINGGDNHPKASNKETVHGQVSAGGSFQAKNGRVTAGLTSGPLSAGDFSCPSGQELVLACVSYTDIVLTDTTNGVVQPIADVSRTFVAIKGC